MSADELAETAVLCLEQGAATIHVHARSGDGSPSLEPDAYVQIIDRVKERVGRRMIIQITTESLGIFPPEQQIALVKAVRPEAVSLALRELAPDDASIARLAGLMEWMKREHVLPQIILYSPAELQRLFELLRSGTIVWKAVPILLVLGRYTPDHTSTPSDLLPFLQPELFSLSNWSVCAFGKHEAACVVSAALHGGNVRVGFENNLLLPDGTTAPSNAALIGPVVRSLSALGHRLVSADEERENNEIFWR
jgi:uncharacterized protein (DUF849 family)